MGTSYQKERPGDEIRKRKSVATVQVRLDEPRELLPDDPRLIDVHMMSVTVIENTIGGTESTTRTRNGIEKDQGRTSIGTETMVEIVIAVIESGQTKIETVTIAGTDLKIQRGGGVDRLFLCDRNRPVQSFILRRSLVSLVASSDGEPTPEWRRITPPRAEFEEGRRCRSFARSSSVSGLSRRVP